MPSNTKHLEEQRLAKLVLKQLRHHQQKVEDDHEDAVDCESTALERHFQQAEENIAISQTVDQSVVDAQIFHRLGQYTRKQAEQLQSGLRKYDVKSFADSLHLHMRHETGAIEDENGDIEDKADLMINFVKLGDCVWQKYTTVPSLDFMHGNEPKVQQTIPMERKTRQIKKGIKAVKPNEMRSDQVEQTETDKRVAMMKKELSVRKQCNFWHFVIDPDDFTHSVENVFHSSFLIKDSWAQLDMKKDPPVLKYRDADAVAGDRGAAIESGDEISNSQYILEFDRGIWSEVISKYQIEKCFLPRMKERPPRDDDTFQRIQGYDTDQSRSKKGSQKNACF